MKKEKMGFTLIELLAVIVILAILLIIAIPSASNYITVSKKGGFISSAQLFVDEARKIFTLSEQLPMNHNERIMVSLSSLEMEKDYQKSAYGNSWVDEKSYIVIKNIGSNEVPKYSYSIALEDEKGYCLELTEEKELDTSLVKKGSCDIETSAIASIVTTEQDGIYISEISYVSDVHTNISETEIIDVQQSTLKSKVTLSETDGKSFITYRMKIYNSNDSEYYFYKTEKISYSNENIVFELDGIKQYDNIGPKETKEIEITFHYKDSMLVENHSLESSLNFKFSNYISISELYDPTGTGDGLHIGDFVNYDAGTWTADEISKIQVGPYTGLVSPNNSLELPNSSYQFGGFAVGTSRNNTSKIAPFNGLGTVGYLKNAATNKPLSGWRIFDVDTTTGKVSLISAGNPEAFFQNGETNAGYISEYIFSKNVNSAWSQDAALNYQARDWSDYVNSELKAENAYILSKSQLEAWYNKYVGSVTNLWTQSQFKKIYSNPRLHNIIDNYSFWWLSTARSSAGPHFVQGDTGRRLRGGNGVAVGIRIVVTLSADVKFSPEEIGTIEITSSEHLTEEYGGNQIYNLWDIQ